MMNILIPMAGEGKRFADEGYVVSKPAIPTYNRRTGEKIPMVVCATLDLPGVEDDGSNIIYIDRDFHKIDGTETVIKKYYPKAVFITLDKLTDGQASTCMEAVEKIDLKEELLIAGCDNGMIMDCEKFNAAKKLADVLVFTYRYNDAVLKNPDSYGWMITVGGGKNEITGVSVKQAVSENPLQDHAVVATFWFKRGSIFVEAAKKMIEENDRINGEFYVDEVIKHILELGYNAEVFEIERYIGWGTPEDYEIYQKTFEYWSGFYEREKYQIK